MPDEVEAAREGEVVRLRERAFLPALADALGRVPLGVEPVHEEEAVGERPRLAVGAEAELAPGRRKDERLDVVAGARRRTSGARAAR